MSVPEEKVRKDIGIRMKHVSSLGKERQPTDEEKGWPGSEKKEKEGKGFGNLPNETIGQIMLVNGETCRFLVLNSQSMVCPGRSQM